MSPALTPVTLDSAFQAVPHDVPLPDVLTELSTYQVAALAEKSANENKADTRNLITRILIVELILKGLKGTTFVLVDKTQPREIQLFIIDFALF